MRSKLTPRKRIEIGVLIGWCALLNRLSTIIMMTALHFIIEYDPPYQIWYIIGLAIIYTIINSEITDKFGDKIIQKVEEFLNEDNKSIGTNANK